MRSRRRQHKHTFGITNIQSLSPQQLAYLAAFIDADGSIVARLVPQHEYVMGWVIRVSVNIHQSSLRRRILDEFQKQLGCGSCRTRGCGTMSDFSINSVEEVQQLLVAILPYLILKKRQAELMLQLIQQREAGLRDVNIFIQNVELVDQISQLNDTILSKRVHTGAAVLSTLRKRGILVE